jgi:uncharacterized protein YukE
LKLVPATHLSYSQRVSRYSFQKLQAALRGPVNPIHMHSLQRFHERHRQWTTDTANALDGLYRYASALEQAADEFDRTRRNSAINSRTAIRSHSEAASIAVKPDVEQIAQAMSVLVDRYNRFYELLHDKQEAFAFDLAASLRRIAASFNDEREAIGVHVEADGNLTLDGDLLRQALQSDFHETERIASEWVNDIREQTHRLRNAPLGSFSRSAQAERRENPYAAYTLPGMFYRTAVHTGLFFNCTW